VLVGVLTRSKVGPVLLRGKQWTTLTKPTAEGMLEPGETQAASERDARSLKEESPYGKIPNALTTFLLSLQAKDAWCTEQKWKAYPDNKVTEEPYRGRWCEDPAGLVRCDGAVYVPNDPATRAEILRVNHDDPWQGGHFGIQRTWKVIKRHYWWPALAKSVQNYCRSCDICQRIKAPRHRSYGLLIPLL
jgi:hypothetical protein